MSTNTDLQAVLSRSHELDLAALANRDARIAELKLEIERLEAQHSQSIDQDNEMLEAIGADPLGTWDDAIATVRNIRGRENSLDVRCQELESRLPRWQLIADNPPPRAHRMLLTNNILARDAHGQMSHVWIGHPIFSRESCQWAAFDGDRKVHNLTHWMALPEAPKP